MDQVIIASTKKRYKDDVVKRAVRFIESGGTKILYLIDIRVVVMWVKSIW